MTASSIPHFYVEDGKEMVKVEVPSDKTITFVGVVDEDTKKQFPKEYAAFKADKAVILFPAKVTEVAPEEETLGPKPKKPRKHK